jgi:hypothetical protein
MPPIQASNRFNIEANRPPISIDFDAPYAPTTMTYHGFSLQVGGVTIGRFTEWTPQDLDRAATPTRELNALTFGQPVDTVPGIADNWTLSWGRVEVWNEEVEKALGEEDIYTSLLHQTRPFAVDEVFLRGLSLYRQFRYLGVWFTGKSTDAFSADGDGIIRVSGTFAFTNRIRIV